MKDEYTIRETTIPASPGWRLIIGNRSERRVFVGDPVVAWNIFEARCSRGRSSETRPIGCRGVWMEGFLVLGMLSPEHEIYAYNFDAKTLEDLQKEFIASFCDSDEPKSPDYRALGDKAAAELRANCEETLAFLKARGENASRNH